MTSPLRIDTRDDRVVATLDRPERRNAIDLATVDALHALCAELENRPRILILTGAGGDFAAGWRFFQPCCCRLLRRPRSYD